MRKAALLFATIVTILTNTTALPAATLTPEQEKAFINKPIQRVIVGLEDEFFGIKSNLPGARLSKKEITARIKTKEEAYNKVKKQFYSDMRSKGHQLKVVYPYEVLPLVALDVTREQALAILDNPLVTKFELDKPAKVAMTEASSFISATKMQEYGYTGEGTTIVIMDTPLHYWDSNFFPGCTSDSNIDNFVSDNPKCPIKRYLNLAEGVNLEQTVAIDTNTSKEIKNLSNHGTLVASTVHSIAPDANIIFINIFSYSNENKGLVATRSDQNNALNWIIKNLGADGQLANYDVLAANLSIAAERTGLPSGHCNDISTASPIVTMLDDFDIVTFIAAGNNGHSNSITEPGCISAAMTIGAQYYKENDYWKCKISDDSDETYIHYGKVGDVTCFSNRNGMVDYIAPGTSILYGKGTSSEEEASGTSFSSPLVAAAYLVYQDTYYYMYEKFHLPFWAEHQLKTQAWPIYSFGSYYSQFSLDSYLSPNWVYSYKLGDNWSSAIPEAKISARNSVSYSINVIANDDKGIAGNVGGLYLKLEVHTEKPSDISIEVSAPDGDGVTFALPETTTANFNGIIGRTVFPGKFASFNGKKAAGDWQVTIRNNGSKEASLFGATLLFVKEGCQAECEQSACGDDLCGGKCGVECSNGVFCDGLETCRYGSCIEGSLDNPACEDGDNLKCTNYCNESTKSCDGVKRIVSGYCAIDGACYKDGDPDPNNGCKSCQASKSFTEEFVVNEAATTCEDGNLCTSNDHCEHGVCIPGTSRDCDDNNPCTQDSCSPLLGCQYVNVEGPCDDNNACTISERCVNGACIGAQQVFCDDGNVCTSDSCDPITGDCIFTNNTYSCEDGNADTIGDKCQDGVCVGGKAASSGCSCNSTNDPSSIMGALLMILSLALLKKRKSI